MFLFIADWDSLLAEANRKQHALQTDKIIDGKPPSLFLLTNQKGFVPERYSLKTIQKKNVVTFPSLKNDGGERADTNMEYLTPMRRSPYHASCEINRSRIFSSTNSVIGRAESFHPQHIPVSRTRSQPISYHRQNRTCLPTDSYVRETVEYIKSNSNRKINELPNNNHNTCRYEQDIAPSLNENYLVHRMPAAHEHEIMMNQC